MNLSFLILLFILILASACFFMILPGMSRRSQVLRTCCPMVAHRGYHCKEKLIPENSMASFRAAVEKGYGIELDLHITRDGKAVVFHDNTLERMCGVKGSVESYTLAELQNFHLLNTSERIPEFSEVLSYINGRVPLLIELKIPGQNTAVCQASYELLKNYHGNFLIQSFNTLGLLWYRKHAPHILRGQLSSDLTRSEKDKPYLVCFLVKHLLLNFIGHPDFISYKLSDLPEPGVTLCRKLFRTPIAVWTLRTEESLKQGQRDYDICIFEKKNENY